MKILMVSAEAVPFAKTGGLADAVSALAIILHKLGHVSELQGARRGFLPRR